MSQPKRFIALGEFLRLPPSKNWYLRKPVMSTSKSPSSKSRRALRSIDSFLFFGSTLVAVATSCSLAGCSHAWEDYDPRFEGSGGGSTTASTSGSSGIGANGGAGGISGTGGNGGTGGTGGIGSSSGAGGSGGQNTGGSGGGVVKCGGTSVLVSDFSGNTPDGIWDIGDWGGATVSETGGELVMALPMNAANGSGAYMHSEYYYDFRDDFVSVEVTKATNTSASAWAYYEVGPDDNNYVEIYQQGTSIIFGWEIAGSFIEHKKIPYDAVAHRFWQLRETAGTVYFETSADGQKWNIEAEKPTAELFPVDFSRIVLGAGADSGQANPGVARFDRLNGGGISKQKYCAISSITDDFNDGAESRQWERSWEDQPGMLAEEGGQFVLHYVADAEAYGGLGSARAFDLTGSGLVIEVPAVPPASFVGGFSIDLNGPDDNDVEMQVAEGNIEFAVDVQGTHQKLGSVLYSPQQHRWWRIREQANTLYWETAPDGKTWTTRLEISPLPVPVTMLDIELAGGTWMAQPMPGECRVDNVNLAP